MALEKTAALLLALVCYLAARALFRFSGRHVLALPVFVSVLLVLGASAILSTDAAVFVEHTRELTFAMDLAVVGMAVPLHQAWRRLGPLAGPMLVGLLVSSALSLAGVLWAGWWLSSPWDITAAVAPKAATMPVALSLVPDDAAHQAVAVAAVFLTGLFGALLTPVALRRAGVVDDRVHAFALGVSAHAIGLVRAQAQHPAHLELAVAGMCGNALVTALLCSLFLS
jgi:putative effector of murein hydrolase